ncbi:MAG: diacylglycerol kinase family lipid kinase [Peptococcaceae bacterium]|nr:diacylglycerol kinase family lipid kinase [Peptococcaceae bacterium]
MLITNTPAAKTFKKLAMIINPAAGKGQYVAGLSRAVQHFCLNGYCVTIYMTEKKDDASAFAQLCGAEYEILVCCGGDGTLNETINGLMKHTRSPALGYIPLGTTNDFANSLGLPKNPRKAAETIMTSNPTAIDVGLFGSTYFTYIAAFGIFTDVSYTTPQETKHALGPLAYFLEGLTRLGDIPVYHVVLEHDLGRVEGDFIFGGVTNSMSVAGLVKLKPDFVSLTDGYFEVFLVKPPQNMGQLQRIISGFITQNYDPECVVLLQTTAVTFHFDKPVAWTRDGENGGEHRDISIRCLPGKLPFLIEPTKTGSA